MTPKLLLINPTMTANGQRLPNAGGIATMEPLGLAYVAALTPPHWDVRIVDEVMEGIPSDYEPDLVGQSTQGTQNKACADHRIPVIRSFT